MWLMFLASIAFISITPRRPPTAPPAPWMPEKTANPPNADARKLGFMKKVPMMMPATAVDATDANRSSPIPMLPLSRTFSYPRKRVMASKTMVAPVKPRNWTPPGFMMKLMSVAMRPTVMDAPGFLTHQTVRESVAIPSMSHRIGRCVKFQKAGPTTALITAQRDAESVMAVSSFVLNLSKMFT